MKNRKKDDHFDGSFVEVVDDVLEFDFDSPSGSFKTNDDEVEDEIEKVEHDLFDAYLDDEIEALDTERTRQLQRQVEVDKRLKELNAEESAIDSKLSGNSATEAELESIYFGDKYGGKF